MANIEDSHRDTPVHHGLDAAEAAWERSLPPAVITPPPAPQVGTNPKDTEAARRAKVPLSVVPTAILAYAAMQMHNGKGKYGSYNFRATGVKFSIYYEAILRHAMALWNGEELDEEGMPNIAGLAANVAILCDATAHGFVIDDRPPKVNERALWDSAQPIIAANNERNANKNPRHYSSADPVATGSNPRASQR